MRTSLIIATYNWPGALEICLNSVLQQTVMPAEVIIADDGSGNSTKLIVEKFKQLLPVPLVHVWHEDNGFKLAQIRNKAAAVAGDYIIQVDGDLILHPHFVQDHIEAAQTGRYICGSRVMLNNRLTENIINGTVKDTSFGFFKKGISNRFNTVYLKKISHFINKTTSYNNLESIRGCNMSYWRKDFIAVNGYNEEFVGWGREDSDLVFRFDRYGLKRSFFKFQGIVYHLHHKENDRSNLLKNDSILLAAKKTPGYTCKKGISQYL
jgi:glycosyltransferase involved in cell wall biosynthesis